MNNNFDTLIDLYNTYQKSYKAYRDSITENTGVTYSQWYRDKIRFERAFLEHAKEVMQVLTEKLTEV